MSRTRRGFFRAVGLAVVAGPVAIPAALSKAGQAAPRVGEIVQKVEVTVSLGADAIKALLR